MACILTSVELDPVRVLIKHPMRECEEKEVEPTLENMQEIVGGFIKCFVINSIPNVYGYYNPPAQFKGSQPNFYLAEEGKEFVGSAVFFRLDKEGFLKDLTDLDVERLNKYMERNMYKSKEHFFEHMTDLYGMEL